MHLPVAVHVRVRGRKVQKLIAYLVYSRLILQGPALYAYNDATFSEIDWRGIKMLQNSIKKDDPLKVGRFGLGFKSVFHMTGIWTTQYLRLWYSISL